MYNALQACQPHNQSTRQKLTYHQPKSTNQLTNLTTRSRVLSEKLTIPQIVRKFPACYGNPTVHYRIHNSPLSFEEICPHPGSPLHFAVCQLFTTGSFYPLAQTPSWRTIPHRVLFNIFAATLQICRPSPHPARRCVVGTAGVA